MKRFLPTLAALLLTSAAWAQSAEVAIDFDQLDQKANNKVKISLSKEMIQMALWLIPKDSDGAKLRKLVSNLQGIYIRSYHFDNAGDYSPSDLNPLRKIITGKGWECVVSVHDKKKGEDTDFCLRKEKDKILGLAILNAQPKELTVVNILGAITPEEFGEIQEWLKLDINIEKPKSQDKPKDED